jgi:hypothetical protein
MAILTYIGIAFLCLGYIGLICVSLSSKSERDEKNNQSIPGPKSTAINEPPKHPSSFPHTGTQGLTQIEF